MFETLSLSSVSPEIRQYDGTMRPELDIGLIEMILMIGYNLENPRIIHFTPANIIFPVYASVVLQLTLSRIFGATRRRSHPYNSHE